MVEKLEIIIDIIVHATEDISKIFHSFNKYSWNQMYLKEDKIDPSLINLDLTNSYFMYYY